MARILRVDQADRPIFDFVNDVAHMDIETINFTDMREKIQEARRVISEACGVDDVLDPIDWDDHDWWPGRTTLRQVNDA